MDRCWYTKVLPRPHGNRCGKKSAWLGQSSRIVFAGGLALSTESVYRMTLGWRATYSRISFLRSMLLLSTRML